MNRNGSKEAAGPLAGFKILDLTTVVMGPFATQVLADLGAEVIKVEPPEGDIMRDVVPTRHAGMGHAFQQTNRNKRGIVLDLKQEAARDALLRLAATADVFVSNVRPAGMRRLRLAYADIAAVNPRIVYVGCYGFGEQGPYAGRPAYDDLIQSMTAVTDLVARVTGGPPCYVPINFCDRVTGLMVANAIQAALLSRERTGKGQFVEVPMFETMTHFVLGDHFGGRAFAESESPPGYGRLLTPFRRPHKTRDGYLCILVYSDRHWRVFLKLIGREELFEDERFRSQGSRSEHIAYVYEFLDREMAKRSNAEWLELLRDADLPHTPARTLEELFDDEHLKAVDMFRTTSHPTQGEVRVTRSPMRFSASPDLPLTPAPMFGEHTVEVLREAGLSEEEIQAVMKVS